MVATAVFMLMVVLLVSVVSQVNTVWQQTDGQKSRRQSARALLDLISRDLQAALGPVDAKNGSDFQFDLNPGGKSRKSSLFLQTSSPGSRNGSDVVSVGYFVRRTSDGSILCRVQKSGADKTLWMNADAMAPATAPDFQGLAADGVLAMFITLYDNKGNVLRTPSQSYSSSSLPYAVEVALVIADTKTARRMVDVIDNSDVAETADQFVNSVNVQYRPGVQVYRTRVDIPQAR